MITHPLRKIFLHLLVYTFIILGIFAIQFRNQSIISKNFGQLRLSVSQPKNHSGEDRSKNSFSINYKGLSLFIDENHPAVLKDTQNTRNLQFLSWESLSDSSFELYFSENISLLCGFTGQNKDVFTITYNGNETEGAALHLPYTISSSLVIMQSSPKKLVLSGKMQQTVLNTASVDESFIHFTFAENNLTYANYEPTKDFVFEEAIQFELAKKEVYDEKIADLRRKVLANFDPTETMSETQVVAFITEHLEKDSYRLGLSKIPQSFINSSKRSFVSSTFLNNLSTMQRSLMMQYENMSYKMQQALEAKTLDVFQAENFPLFLLTQNKNKIESLLQIPKNQERFEPSLLEAAGIIETYLVLTNNKRKEAEILEPILFVCIDTIQKACEQEDEQLFLFEKEKELGLEASLRLAQALIDYAHLIQNKDMLATAYFLANTSLEKNNMLSAQVIANLYPNLVKTPFYPHIEILSQDDKNPIWAWTSAKDLRISQDADKTIRIQIEFPVGQSHYIIMHNIEAFEAIEIYDMLFRTDPRFESYDSSGYVYDSANKNLLLKVKNKVPVETIKLYYHKPNSTPKETEANDGIDLENEFLTEGD